MRISVGFSGFGPLGPTLPAIQAADAGGLDGVWSCEHIGFHDALVPSATYLATTRSLEIGLVGLGPASRHPGMTATELASLCELGPGRVRVQVGTGDPALVAKLGARYPRPLATVRTFVHVLRELLAGHELDVEHPIGRFAGFQLAPLAGPPAIDVMAIRPKMLRLACEIGDGVSLSAGASLAYLTDTVAEVEAGLAELGRDRSQFRITALAFGLIAPDPDPAIAMFASMMTMFPADSAAYLARGAFDTEAYLAAMNASRTMDAAKLITPDAIRAITLAAGLDEIAPAIDAYARTGIDELGILPLSPPPLLPDVVEAIAAQRPAPAV